MLPPLVNDQARRRHDRQHLVNLRPRERNVPGPCRTRASRPGIAATGRARQTRSVCGRRTERHPTRRLMSCNELATRTTPACNDRTTVGRLPADRLRLPPALHRARRSGNAVAVPRSHEGEDVSVRFSVLAAGGDVLFCHRTDIADHFPRRRILEHQALHELALDAGDRADGDLFREQPAPAFRTGGGRLRARQQWLASSDRPATAAFLFVRRSADWRLRMRAED